MTRPTPSAAVKKDILAAIERGACSGPILFIKRNSNSYFTANAAQIA
jgi:hypothetical protein